MEVTQRVVERMVNNTLKRFGCLLCVGDDVWPGRNGLVAGMKIKKRKTRREVGKGSGKSNEAQESDA
jgi:hypothetical protein